VLFVDVHNSCRSQLAEAIGASLDQPKFLFASAGVEPQPITPATLEFMKAKGLDAAHLSPKSVQQVPNLEHYHVIVILAPEAKRAFAVKPRKTVMLDWSVADPSKVTGSPAEIRAAYEQTYQFLHEHLQDLVEAVLGDEDE